MTMLEVVNMLAAWGVAALVAVGTLATIAPFAISFIEWWDMKKRDKRWQEQWAESKAAWAEYRRFTRKPRQ